MDLLILSALALIGIGLFLVADPWARFQSWLLFEPFGWFTEWIWGEDNSNFTREGTRTFTRWGVRLFAIAWLAFAAFGIVGTLMS